MRACSRSAGLDSLKSPAPTPSRPPSARAAPGHHCGPPRFAVAGRMSLVSHADDGYARSRRGPRTRHTGSPSLAK